MATTAHIYGPFDSGAGANWLEADWRDYADLWASDGVIYGLLNGLEVFADSSGRQSKVRTGEHRIKGHKVGLTSQITLAHDTNSSGNPRIDRVVARIDANTNLGEFDVLKGTAAGSPTAPSVTYGGGGIWEVTLARIAIANGYTTIAAADVTDERKFSFGASPKLNCTAYRATNQSIADDTLVSVEFGNHTSIADLRMHSTSADTERFVAPWDGWYDLTGSVEFAPDADGYRAVRVIDSGTSTEWAGLKVPNIGASVEQRLPFSTGAIQMSAGQYLRVQVRHTAGAALNVMGSGAGGRTYATFRYLGP